MMWFSSFLLEEFFRMFTLSISTSDILVKLSQYETVKRKLKEKARTFSQPRKKCEQPMSAVEPWQMLKEICVLLRLIVLVSTIAFALLRTPYAVAQSSLDLSIAESIQLYAKSIGMQDDQPTSNFVGFVASRAESTFKIEVLHADSPLDVVINEFSCYIAKDPSAVCKLVLIQPRCFYYAQSGQFSVKNFREAFKYGVELGSSLGIEPDQITQLKIWQSARKLNGKLSIGAKSLHFSCEHSAQQISCQETSDSGDDEV